jgi:hypothetical protein
LEYAPYYHELLERLKGEDNLPKSVAVEVQPVCPWGAFTHPLNIALKIALDEGYEQILFQSLEVSLTTADRDLLLAHFDHHTLVIGPVLEGHVFNEGENPLRGRTTPWNTCAIWSVAKLSLVGFPSIGDGIPNEVPGGVEVLSLALPPSVVCSLCVGSVSDCLRTASESSLGGEAPSDPLREE